MTVQFPNYFVIPHLAEIQIRNFEPDSARSAFSVDEVQVPVDHWAVVKIFVAEESKPMLTTFAVPAPELKQPAPATVLAAVQ